MSPADLDLVRTWLFGPGADGVAHRAMLGSGADALIVDLEDFTPPQRREEARRGLATLLSQCHSAARIAAVRIRHEVRRPSLVLLRARAFGSSADIRVGGASSRRYEEN